MSYFACRCRYSYCPIYYKSVCRVWGTVKRSSALFRFQLQKKKVAGGEGGAEHPLSSVAWLNMHWITTDTQIVYDKKLHSITSSTAANSLNHYESVAVIKHYNSIIEIDFFLSNRSIIISCFFQNTARFYLDYCQPTILWLFSWNLMDIQIRYIPIPRLSWS